MERAWILVGMMGAGKSSVGRALAEAAGRPFMDTDQLLVQRFGRSIAQIFDIYGEAAFRDHETSIVRNLEPGQYVLATGGGIVMREENWTELRRLGHICYLAAEPETLIERLAMSKKKRPLLEAEDWEQRLRDLLERRIPAYKQADFEVLVDGNEIEAASQRVLEEFNRREAGQ